jgi:hypothetical protein
MLVLANLLNRKHGNIVPQEYSARVEALMRRFQGPSTATANVEVPTIEHVDSSQRDNFVVLPVDDISRMVTSLYPQRRPPSLSSDQETLHSGVHSSASSISGFSMFKNAGSTDQLPSTFTQWPRESQLGAYLGSRDSPIDGNYPSPNMNADPLLDATDLDMQQLPEACNALQELETDSRPSWVVFASAGVTDLRPIDENWQNVAYQVRQSHARNPASSKSSRCSELITSLISEPLDDGAGRGPGIDRLRAYYRWLQEAIEDRIAVAQDNSDYVDAHDWLCRLRMLQGVYANGADLEALRCTIEGIEETCHQSLIEVEVTNDTCEAWLRVAARSLENWTERLLSIASGIQRLRDKMWYVADVRTSAAYDEARSVIGALRIMGKPKRTTRARAAPPLRHWTGAKMSSTNLHLKTEAQILELLSALPEQGGPNKLSDEQSRSTVQWMERNSIENFCRGEERLHRLCMEIHKCADQLTTSDASFITNNPLFALDGIHSQREYNGSKLSESLSGLKGTATQLGQLRLRTNAALSIDGISNVSHPLSSTSSHEYLESRSPTLTHKSSAPFWSPVMTEARSSSSATSIGSYHTQTVARFSGKKPLRAREIEPSNRLDSLRQRLAGLLLSDLTSLLFTEGSETDMAFWNGLGGSLAEKHFQTQVTQLQHASAKAFGGSERPQMGPGLKFDFTGAFRSMLKSFAATSNPSTKLGLLHDIDRLLPMYVEEVGVDITHPRVVSDAEPAKAPKADAKVAGFTRLFQDGSLRPQGIFRDLQYIAALTPSSVLEGTPQGRAFWNAAVAMSDLRQQARNIMVETADSIVAYHSNNRGHGRSSSTAQQQRDSATFSVPSRSSSAEEISRYTMSDAAYLLQITAKEGDHVAQRELATLYLTHPDLTDHIIAPFARPKDVFKEELESKWRRNQDPNRCDPATMCVAHHWMSLSAKGGDALAVAYLRQREEMDRLL